MNKGYLLVLALGLTLVFACKNAGTPKASAKLPSIQLSPEVSIGELRAGYESGGFTIREVVQYYLHRIDSIDSNGPQLSAVLTINPEALAIAQVLEQELKAGNSRGALHGIPVLLKDNIDTHDKMPCTAGAKCMKENYPTKDSHLAAQLREAGAVILGKTNLSEWANFHSYQSSSGWSAVGGQTKNPYKLSYNPCGSSAGSGVAVSANLAPLAIGTETNGSIVCPSNNNGIVGIKPTVGLISRTGIIPISHTQDTGGPMARSVTDAAIALGVLTATDTADEKTLVPNRKALTDYTPHLTTDGLKGKRLGYYTLPLAKSDDEALKKLMQESIAYCKAQGATIIAIDSILPEETRKHSFQILLHEFKAGINAYLAEKGEDAPVGSLSEIVEVTFADEEEMRYHDHKLLKDADATGGLLSAEYLTAKEKARKQSQDEGIDRLMALHQLDAFIAPTGSPAWPTSLENGDTYGVFSSSPAAVAGYPNITVPMGLIDGLPVGMSIFGRAWSESTLIEIAFAFEQGTNKREPPTYIK